MAEDDIEVEVPDSIEAITEVQEPDRASEIVYLYCTSRDPFNKTDNKGRPHQTEIAKAGEPAFIMKAGQIAKMKRSLAEWHVAKTSSYDHIQFHLKLDVKSEAEMSGIRAILEAQKKARENAAAKVAVVSRTELVKKAVAAGATQEDAENMSDADLATLTA